MIQQNPDDPYQLLIGCMTNFALYVTGTLLTADDTPRHDIGVADNELDQQMSYCLNAITDHHETNSFALDLADRITQWSDAGWQWLRKVCEGDRLIGVVLPNMQTLKQWQDQHKPLVMAVMRLANMADKKPLGKQAGGESIGYTPIEAEMNILKVISDSKIAILQIDIAEKAGYGRKETSIYLQNLEKAKLVNRPHGERKGYALTDEGKKLVE